MKMPDPDQDKSFTRFRKQVLNELPDFVEYKESHIRECYVSNLSVYGTIKLLT